MGADPALAKLVTPSAGRMTIQEIKLQLASRELAARRDWERKQDLRDIRRLVDNRNTRRDAYRPHYDNQAIREHEDPDDSSDTQSSTGLTN